MVKIIFGGKKIVKVKLRRTKHMSAFTKLFFRTVILFVLGGNIIFASGVQKSDDNGNTLSVGAVKSSQNGANEIKISPIQTGNPKFKKITLDKESYDINYQKRNSRDNSFLVKDKLIKEEIKKTHKIRTHQKEKIYLSPKEKQIVRIRSSIDELYNLKNKIVEETNVQSEIEKYSNEKKIWGKIKKGTIADVDVSEDGKYVFSKREDSLEVFHEVYDYKGNIIYEKKGSKVKVKPVEEKKSILIYEPLDDKTVVTFLNLDSNAKNEKYFPPKFVMEEKINNNSDFVITDITKKISYIYNNNMQQKCEFNSKDSEILYLNDLNYVLLSKDGTTLKEVKIYDLSSCNLVKNVLIPNLVVNGDAILPKRIDVSDNLKFFIVGSMAKEKGGEVNVWIFNQNSEILWSDRIKIDTPWFPRANPNFINNDTQIRILMEGADVERIYNIEGALIDNK